MIINELSALQDYALGLRIERLNKVEFTTLIESMTELPAETKQAMKQHHELFMREFWEHVNEGALKPNLMLEALPIRGKALSMTPLESAQQLQAVYRSLLACVFGYWTVEHMLKSGGDSGTLRPHAGQICAIFRLLGLDYFPIEEDDFVDVTAEDAAEEGLTDAVAEEKQASTERHQPNGMKFVPQLSSANNHLVQLSTGEGKSVVLGVMSTVLALLGYDIDCACYSEYLSKRDYDAFQPIFLAFGVVNHISYGTFNGLCEKLTNKRGDIRALVNGHVLANGGNTMSVVSKRPRIILIDEVDVFFSRDFYGSEYRPMATITSPAIKDLFRYLWSVRADDSVKFRHVRSSPEYVACAQEFGDWSKLLAELTKAALADLRSQHAPGDYKLIDNCIAYTDQDSIAFNKVFGYKTLFAYFQEHAVGRISDQVLESKIGFIVDCGTFSYAEIPKQYCCIMGVTGTLSTLTAAERTLLKDESHIESCTYVASVYGQNQLVVAAQTQGDCLIEDATHFHDALCNEIKGRLRGSESANDRAVLVFFETIKHLEAFYKSQQRKDAGFLKIAILHEETSDAATLTKKASSEAQPQRAR